MKSLQEEEEKVMYERSRHLIDCHIAGFAYYDGLEVIDQLTLGATVALCSEPDNPYDPDAIAVYFGKTKLGYVTQAKNSDLSQLLYFGYGDILEARISARNLEMHPERQFRITVRLKDHRTKNATRV